MAQGKAYTTEQRQMILESLRPYLELGYSRSKACKLIGFDESTLSKWISKDEALSMKIEGWENTVNAIVMANIVDAIKRESELQDDLRKENTWKWAERKMRDNGFGIKTETDITSGGKPVPMLNSLYVQDNNSNKENSESE